MSLKERLLRRKINKQTRHAHFSNWEEVQTIRLLAETGDEAENVTIEDVCRQMEKAGKTVWLTTYTDSKKPVALSFGTPLCRKDFTLFGSPKKTVIALLKQHADVLIDLSKRPSLAMRHIALQTNADFKTGKKLSPEDTDGIHDMLIQTDNHGMLFVFQQIVHYLKTIRGND